MRKLTLAFAAAAALSVAVPAAASTTIISENFSTGFGTFTPSGQVGIATGNDYVPCCSTTGTAANMSNPFVAFGSGDQPSGTITSGTFALLAGESYTLSFDVAALGLPDSTDPITALIGPYTIVVTRTTDNNLDTTFHPFSLTFTALANSTTTLRFTSSGANGVDAILDNVLLTTTANLTSPVPEPSTWAMMLLGFAAIGSVLRRKHKAVLA